MADRVLILGASARAAAASARRAGLDPFAIDLFADADTEQICECLRCPPDRYPEGLFELARQAPPMPWMYTGGLENYPALIAGLCRERELLGHSPAELYYVRDPFFVSAGLLRKRGFAYPDFVAPGTPPPQSGNWLRKPLRGSGGSGIRVASPSDLARIADLDCGFYLQEFVPGDPVSAVFTSRDFRCQLLGITRQLIGTSWLHATGFHYAGNIGPVDPGSVSCDYLQLLGDRITGKTGIRGVWGVDFIEGRLRTVAVEVNPRYPASAEVIEFATGRPVLSSGLDNSARPTKTVGKAIYYASQRLTFPASGPWYDSVRHAADVWRRPDFADVPHPGEVIEAGHPVLTILTEADTEAECLNRLQSRAAELDRMFGFPAPEGEICRP